ncbi:Gfo/Idh/MocA family oxidoreductase [Methylocaldum sp.]|uniref:Gfo/Idh/MocA family protein n=1 Tax=Methylocaldum sp. TaxID=1969727 RepID=UPI002D650E3B|nr:Gfo/Idh/MocA family oxidoreductase [Methylocaldum sp.]HYE35249.1 Gfo/Idh/MocA family oxidoreductase [Methylocaldum sp.]
MKRLQARLSRRRESVLDSLLTGLDRLAGTTGQWPGSRMRDRADAPGPRTPIAIVGCGFVADFYARTLPLHPELELIGVMDRDGSRAARFASRHGTEVYPSLTALLDDPRVEVVVNLTNPKSHFAVSRASLEAGKHVYSEKPLAMVLAEAEELVALAEARGLVLASAPCSILGESAQALGKALRREAVGPVRIVYVEIDDGPIHKMHPEEWASPSGTPWPWQDEFAVGCTMEHAGYYLTWLAAFFGPARSVTAFSSCLIPDKHPELSPEIAAPDFSVACIRFHSGVVARLTCSIVAPHDHSLRIIGDKGVLTVDECWHYGAPVRLRCFTALGLRAETYPWLGRHWLTRALFGLNGRPYGPTPRPSWRCRLRRHEMDYCRGIAELAAAVREGRPCRLSARFALHVNEIALAIQQARETGSSTPIRSNFPPVEFLLAPS